MIRRTALGKEETQRLRHRHPAPRSGGPGDGVAPGDTEVLRERGGTEGVPGVEGATETGMTASGGASELDAPPLPLTGYFR